MTSEVPDEPPSAPKWERLPGPVRLKLAHMIADHLRVHGSANYDVLRDHPDFSCWFGTHLGHRGEKRFDRMVKSVRRSQPRKTSRRSTSEASGPERPSSPGEECPDPSVAKQLAHAGAPSFEELVGGLCRRRFELEVSLSGCVNEFGEIVEPALHEQYTTRFVAITLAIGQLSRQYHGALTTGAVLEPMLGQLLPPGDANTQQIATEANNLLKRSTGLPAIRRTS